MQGCDKYAEYVEKISLLIDGELSEEDEADVRAHISECDDCRRVYEAFSGISDAICGDAVDAPEALAPGIMYKIGLQRKRGESNIRRFAWGRYTTIAAMLAIVLLVAGKSGLFGAFSDSAERSGFAAEAAEAAPDYEITDQSVAFAMPVEEEAAEAECNEFDTDMAAAEAETFEEPCAEDECLLTSGGSPSASEWLSIEADSHTLTDREILEALRTEFFCADAESSARPDSNPDMELRVTDASGDIFTVSVWFDGDTLLWAANDTDYVLVSPKSVGDFKGLIPEA